MSENEHREKILSLFDQAVEYGRGMFMAGGTDDIAAEREIKKRRDELSAKLGRLQPAHALATIRPLLEELRDAMATCDAAHITDGGRQWFDSIKVDAAHAKVEAFLLAMGEPVPIDMVLHCPACGLQHIDTPEDRTPSPSVPDGVTAVFDPEQESGARWSDGIERRPAWTNPPHRSHLCHGCGHIWRPADVPTNGVQAVKTKGKSDSPIARGTASHR